MGIETLAAVAALQEAAKAARERAAGAPDAAFLRDQADADAAEEAPPADAEQPAAASKEAAYLAELHSELQVLLSPADLRNLEVHLAEVACRVSNIPRPLLQKAPGTTSCVCHLNTYLISDKCSF